MWRADSLEDLDAGKDWGQEEKVMIEDEMFGWHHQHNGHGLGWTPGVGDGQGGLACCGSWGCKESDTTEWLNWTEPVERSVSFQMLTKEAALQLMWRRVQQRMKWNSWFFSEMLSLVRAVEMVNLFLLKSLIIINNLSQWERNAMGKKKLWWIIRNMVKISIRE